MPTPSAIRFALNRPVLLALCVLLSASAGAEVGTADSARFYPAGKQMLFSMYSLISPQLEQARNLGYTAVGPYYSKPGKNPSLRNAAKAGLPVIYQAGRRIDFDATDPPDLEEELLFLQRDVEQASQSGDVAIWSLATEELRYWRDIEMEWLRRATQTIRQYDPAKRPIYMYEPNHRKAASLAKTVPYLDYVAKGSYTNFVGMKNSRTWLRWSMEQTIAVAEEQGKTPLALLWMARDQKTAADVAAIEARARHDVYLSLILGAKGILIYSGWNKRKGFTEHFDRFFSAYSKLAEELNGQLGLADVFLFGKPSNPIEVSVRGSAGLQSFEYRKESFSYPVASTAHFEYQDSHYLFLVNSGEHSIDVKLKGLPQNVEATDIFASKKTELRDNVTLDRYAVVALTWR